MNTLNAIQILDIQDLVKAHIDTLYKKLDNPNYKGAKQLVISEINRLEDANKTLEKMWDLRINEQD